MMEINMADLNMFMIEDSGNGFYTLSMNRCFNKIKIKIPFVLNEDVAQLAGMMPDGSLIKDIRRIYFTQKKDFTKILLFKQLLFNLFNPNNTIFIRWGHNAYETYTNSKVLAHFLHYVLDFKSSNQQLRIPFWIFDSEDNIKRTYLREAYAMEGTILKSLYEIRFITKGEPYALDLQRLLGQVGIKSSVKPRFGGTPKTIQHRISICSRENFKRFKEIGFTYPFHLQRFNRLCEKYKI